MTFIIIIALIINAIIANIVGKVGKTKEIGYNTAFFVSFLLSPLIGLLLVIASNPLTAEQIAEKNKPKQSEHVNVENDGSGNKSKISGDRIIIEILYLAIIIIAVVIIFVLIGTGILG